MAFDTFVGKSDDMVLDGGLLRLGDGADASSFNLLDTAVTPLEPEGVTEGASCFGVLKLLNEGETGWLPACGSFKLLVSGDTTGDTIDVPGCTSSSYALKI